MCWPHRPPWGSAPVTMIHNMGSVSVWAVSWPITWAVLHLSLFGFSQRCASLCVYERVWGWGDRYDGSLLIPALLRLRQENCQEFQASLSTSQLTWEGGKMCSSQMWLSPHEPSLHQPCPFSPSQYLCPLLLATGCVSHLHPRLGVRKFSQGQSM